MTTAVPCQRCAGTGQTISLCAAERPCPTCHGTGEHRWVSVFIQARLASHRYPGKVLVPVGGVPMLQRVYDLARQLQRVDQVVGIAPWGDRFSGLPVWAWPDLAEDDVLGRYQRAAQQAHADVIVRLTGDCPVLDLTLCQAVLDRLLTEPDLDYVRTIDVPSGLDCESFTRDLLDRAAEHATAPADREHVTPWMQRQARIGTVCLASPWRGPNKVSIDTPEDWHNVTAWLTSPRRVAFETASVV